MERGNLQKERRALPASALLAALVLALSVAGRADDTPGVAGAPTSAMPDSAALDGNADPVAPNAELPKARVRRPPVRRTLDQRLDATVRRMSRGLDLNADQQVKLREILSDEYRLARQQSQTSQPGGDRVAARMAIVDATKARIRAMLTSEQKAKYESDVPHEMTAPAQADLNRWMQVQEAARRQDEGAAK